MVLQLSEDGKILTPYSEHETVYTQKLNAKALKQESMNPGLTAQRQEQHVHRERVTEMGR